jgi:predicted acylesterase/phospholipase RssA
MARIVHLGDGDILEAPRPKKPEGKRALVLGGGGVLGAAYEIGALLALDDALVDCKVTDFDIYVGTSAGAFINAFLANGIRPDEFARSQIGRAPAGVPGIGRGEILQKVPGRLRRGGLAWAGAVRNTARKMATQGARPSLVDTFFLLTEGISSWRLYTTAGLEAYLKKLFSTRGRTNRFEKLEKQLFITATDLDTAERIVFGEEGAPKATISQAAAASAAIPIIYEPVRIKGREYLDGGLRSATNVDVAIAHGASFVVLVNPLVPYLRDARYLLRGFDEPVQHISDGGLGRLVAQVFRIMAQAQLDKELDLVRVNQPDVDILVIEPRRDDEHLFVSNLMDYEARERVAQEAFSQVAVDLVTHFPEIKPLFQRAGIDLSKQNLVEQLQRVLAGGTAEALVERDAEETA